MTKRQVQDLLGAFYKGVGRVVFADGNVFGGGSSEVVRVEYDPSEAGLAH